MRLLVLAFAFFVVPTLAHANGRFPSANQVVFHPTDGQTLAVRTTFGLLLSHDNGAHFSYVCEGLLGFRSVEDPAIGMFADGSLLISMFVGQRQGTPDGCAWPFVDPRLEDFVAIDNVIDVSTPSRGYVVTSAGGRANGLWRATDNGATWEPIGPRFDDVLFETVEVTTSDPSRLYMTGAIPPTSTAYRRPFVYRSEDSGEHWTLFEHALLRDDAQSDRNLYLSAVDPLDENRLYLRISGEPDDRLMISDDGGESLREIMRLPSMLGFARSVDGATVWVGSPVAGLYRSEDRGEHFTRISDVAASCLAVRGGELWACGKDAADGFALGRSTDDGEHFEEVMRLVELDSVPECPSNSDVSTMCEPALDALRSLLGVDSEDAGVADASAADAATTMDASRADASAQPPGTASCRVAHRSSTPPNALATVLALFVSAFARRRSRDKRPRRQDPDR